jgi:hypothetical protein
MSDDPMPEIEYDESQIEYEEGSEAGYAYASEEWDEQRDREGLTGLVYRQPRQMLWQSIQDWKDCHGCPDAYLRGFQAGMVKALDERDAHEWLSTLPGYH